MRVRIIRASARLSAKSDVIDRARARRNCQPIFPAGDFRKEAAHLGGRSISARMGGRQLATSEPDRKRVSGFGWPVIPSDLQRFEGGHHAMDQGRSYPVSAQRTALHK